MSSVPHHGRGIGIDHQNSGRVGCIGPAANGLIGIEEAIVA